MTKRPCVTPTGFFAWLCRQANLNFEPLLGERGQVRSGQLEGSQNKAAKIPYLRQRYDGTETKMANGYA